MLVSILARPAGRALRRDLREQRDRVLRVSILARPAGRALRVIASAMPAMPHPVRVSILARPAGRALRVIASAMPNPTTVFQSSPDENRTKRFNPRPARGPGAA